MFKSNMTVGEIVARLPQAAELFQTLGVDYCCGGNRKLSDALSEKGLEETPTLARLEALAESARPQPVQDFTAITPSELCDYIVNTHHAYLRQSLPQIGNLVQAVLRAHGAAHPELFKVGSVFGALRGDLEQHILHEELVLFPALTFGEEQTAAAQLAPDIIHEHEGAGALLAELRSITQDYTVPSDACPSYALLYKMLPELEHDLHQHIHHENNILLKQYDIR